MNELLERIANALERIADYNERMEKKIYEDERKREQKMENIKEYPESFDHVTIVPDDIPNTYNKN
jgi:hypothetical protein